VKPVAYHISWRSVDYLCSGAVISWMTPQAEDR
jgi:hypothetical protein